MRYGWKPDLPDFRDRPVLEAPHLQLAKLTSGGGFIPPGRVDLRPLLPPPYDQGELGSCTANAIAAAVQYERRRQGFADDFVPSRLFIYYNERAAEGTITSDSGAAIRDGIKSVNNNGDCPETDWPYDVMQYTGKPPQNCYDDALKYRALDYWRVPRALMQWRGCIAAGYPIVFGFSVYDSFESDQVAKDGMVPMPAQNEKLLGGHAVLAVGYDDTAQRLIVRNSWGPGWGDGGYFHLPYQFIMDPNLSDDFWTIKTEAD